MPQKCPANYHTRINEHGAFFYTHHKCVQLSISDQTKFIIAFNLSIIQMKKGRYIRMNEKDVLKTLVAEIERLDLKLTKLENGDYDEDDWRRFEKAKDEAASREDFRQIAIKIALSCDGHLCEDPLDRPMYVLSIEPDGDIWIDYCVGFKSRYSHFLWFDTEEGAKAFVSLLGEDQVRRLLFGREKEEL